MLRTEVKDMGNDSSNFITNKRKRTHFIYSLNLCPDPRCHSPAITIIGMITDLTCPVAILPCIGMLVLGEVYPMLLVAETPVSLAAIPIVPTDPTAFTPESTRAMLALAFPIDPITPLPVRAAVDSPIAVTLPIDPVAVFPTNPKLLCGVRLPIDPVAALPVRAISMFSVTNPGKHTTSIPVMELAPSPDSKDCTTFPTNPVPETPVKLKPFPN